ncbi:protein-tyrosine phosphatase [Rhodococcus sp. OK519]|uniref:tyrosine-protein phosphatase n=1 Tax=Rhodococcus sp. OK519 TaxID=2135729 RepID=UPI000D46CE74|nr:protein-tyrosine phosphatase [Rhodococcus sp. OK519]
MAPSQSLLRRTIAALAATIALTLGGPAVTAAAPVTDLTIADRSLHLEGAPNARDVGGYTTSDGRTVRTGLVFRSDALDRVTPADLATLERLRVREVDDLRTVLERTALPDRVPAGATYNVDDVLGGSPLTTLVDLPAAYRDFVFGPSANTGFAAVFKDVRDITHSGGSVLYHCSAGKDRTGWTTAVLLTLLGVDRATVNADYLLSNYYRNTSETDPIDGVSLSLLDTSFRAADERYGSFDGYVRWGLGLTDQDVAAIKATMLE